MKKSVLVIDDDRSVRESLKKVLGDAGWAVSLAADGRDVEQRLDGIDLLILDLNLPTRDGLEVLRRVNAGVPLLPVVMITGMPDRLDVSRIPGIRALLGKPLDAPMLLETVEALLAETPEQRLARLDRAESPPRRPALRERFIGASGGFPRWSRGSGMHD